MEDQFSINVSVKNHNLILYTRFRKVEEVIPLGYSTECAISQILNQQYLKISQKQLQTWHLNVISLQQVKTWRQFSEIRIILVSEGVKQVQELACGEPMFLQSKLGLASTTNRPVHLQRLKQYH